MSGKDQDPYRCSVCGALFVVPALARSHEDKHREEKK